MRYEVMLDGNTQFSCLGEEMAHRIAVAFCKYNEKSSFRIRKEISDDAWMQSDWEVIEVSNETRIIRIF